MNDPSYLLDTSFLVRLLTRDPVPLFKRAAAFLDGWAQPMPKFIVPDLVLVEAYFALQHHFHYPKAEALAALHGLITHPAISVSDGTLAVLSLPDFASTRPGFVDRLIHGTSQACHKILVTFEKSARKLPATLVLEE